VLAATVPTCVPCAGYRRPPAHQCSTPRPTAHLHLATGSSSDKFNERDDPLFLSWLSRSSSGATSSESHRSCRQPRPMDTFQEGWAGTSTLYVPLLPGKAHGRPTQGRHMWKVVSGEVEAGNGAGCGVLAGSRT
jgi:hypothetical protein